MILPSEVRMKCNIRPEGGSEALRAGLSHMQQLLEQKRQHKDNLDNVRIEAEKMPYLERCATISAIEDLKQRVYSENTNDLLPKIQKSNRTKGSSDIALKEVNLSLPKLQQFYSQSMTELGTGYVDNVYKEKMGGKMLGSLRFERLKTFVPKSPEPESPLKDRGTLIETQVSNKKSSKMYRGTENIQNIRTKQPSKVDKSRDRLHIVGNKDSPLVRYKLPTYRDNDVKRPRLVRNKTNTNIYLSISKGVANETHATGASIAERSRARIMPVIPLAPGVHCDSDRQKEGENTVNEHVVDVARKAQQFSSPELLKLSERDFR